MNDEAGALSDPRIGERLAVVRERLVAAARSAGRRPEDITLVAVSKFHPADAVMAAYAFGQRDFGENYVQEALAKQDALAKPEDQGSRLRGAPGLGPKNLRPDIRWHCIGHVQTNKAKDVAGRFDLIHTVDSLPFAQALARRLPDTAPRQAVLIQVNIGSEAQKAGVFEAGLPALAEAVLALPRLDLRGLMCLPPFFDNGDAARPFFARLRTLRDEIAARFGVPLSELSMGMSGDFVPAVEEGASLVRIGTDIFGQRPAQP